MKHYLLSIEQPDGGPAAPEILEPVMRDVAAFNEELRAAGAWVFAGGLDRAEASFEESRQIAETAPRSMFQPCSSAPAAIA